MRPKQKTAVATIILTVVLTFCLTFRFVLEKQNQSTCLNNMRLLGQALAMYRHDYDDRWPLDTVWENNAVHTSPLAGCPVLKRAEKEMAGYAFNALLRGGIAQSEIAYPELTIAVCEAPLNVLFTASVNPYRHFALQPPAGDKAWLRHNGGAHYLFCDSHVRWLRPEDINDESDEGHSGIKPAFHPMSRSRYIEMLIRAAPPPPEM